MHKVLTDAAVKRAKPKLNKRGELTCSEIPDGGLPGLYLIVQPSGKKSWAVRYRHCGKPRKFTTGPYPRIHLADGRQAARKVIEQLKAAPDSVSVADFDTDCRDFGPAPSGSRSNLSEGAIRDFQKGRRLGHQIV